MRHDQFYSCSPPMQPPLHGVNRMFLYCIDFTVQTMQMSFFTSGDQNYILFSKKRSQSLIHFLQDLSWMDQSIKNPLYSNIHKFHTVLNHFVHLFSFAFTEQTYIFHILCFTFHFLLFLVLIICISLKVLKVLGFSS